MGREDRGGGGGEDSGRRVPWVIYNSGNTHRDVFIVLTLSKYDTPTAADL